MNPGTEVLLQAQPYAIAFRVVGKHATNCVQIISPQLFVFVAVRRTTTRSPTITEQTFYRWKKKYVGLEIDQVRQLKQLQEENGKLKKLVAELSLDKAMLPRAPRSEIKSPSVRKMGSWSAGSDALSVDSVDQNLSHK